MRNRPGEPWRWTDKRHYKEPVSDPDSLLAELGYRRVADRDPLLTIWDIA